GSPGPALCSWPESGRPFEETGSWQQRRAGNRRDLFQEVRTQRRQTFPAVALRRDGLESTANCHEQWEPTFLATAGASGPRLAIDERRNREPEDATLTSRPSSKVQSPAPGREAGFWEAR